MKSKIIKLTPKFLLQALQGKATDYASNLPGDTELLDLDYDLFSNQIRAVIRSDSFIDATENEPTPELKLTYSTITGRSSQRAKGQESPIISTNEKIQISTVQKTSKIEEEFTPEQRNLLTFRIESEQVIVKPSKFLKTEWADINETVRSLGGKWVKGDIISYWTIPL